MKPLRKPSAASLPRRTQTRSARSASESDAGGHVPVLRDEIVRNLARPGAIFVDATVGNGGHAAALLSASGPEARLLGIDLDEEAIHEAGHVLAAYGDRARLVHGTYAEVRTLAERAGFARATGLLFDLGLRSSVLDADRGFSFRGSSALDMRFDARGAIPLPEPSHPALRRLERQRGAFTAAEVLRFLSARELEDILRQYGEERAARRIADAIVAERRRANIATTSDLVSLVVRALPPRFRHGRIHAATRTFQALRIAVNRELESLELGVGGALHLLTPGSRVAVVSYHSLEDRIVKRLFREAVSSGSFSLVVKHPLTPSVRERQENPQSRSAKLRIIEHTPTP